MNWITLLNIENAPRVERVFRLAFMVSNGRKIIVRERAISLIKTGATGSEKTNNDGMHKNIYRGFRRRFDNWQKGQS
jgi:hypothetical protein